MTERRLGIEALALQAAPAPPGHLGRGASFVKEDEAMRLLLHVRLAPFAPVLTRPMHVRALLFAGPQRFF
jgi:hypothetical protein